ncbi:MAG: DUF1232 domain-containing protein [Desulfobacteraceae bacterium]|nr:MAG: DUF1232 domain-containing protein [Desulfobacteraceae bacterium]
MKRILNGINEGFIRKGASEIRSEDLKRVIEKADEIMEKIVKGGPLKRFISDVVLLIALVKDYWNGKYRRIAWGTIAAIAFVLLYVLSPIDIIPDVIPFIGLLDDALVLGICLILIERDLEKYIEWKNGISKCEDDVQKTDPSVSPEAA